MVTIISCSPAQTETFAEELGKTVQAGCVIGLNGDLGAGKTRFVKGLARGIGSPARVHSPTFALLNIYEGGRFPIFHLDLYRLQTQEEILAAGLEEYFSPSGVAVIEWIERWQGPKPACYYNVQMESLSETERRIVYEYSGS